MNREEIDRTLSEMLSAPASGSAVRPELAHAIEERIGRALSPVRPLKPARYYAAGFALIFLAPILAGVGLLRPSGIVGMSVAMILIGFGGLAICGGLLAMSLAADMSPGSRRPAPPVALTVGILIVLAAIFGALFPYRPETSFWLNSGKCLLLGGAFALPAAALAWRLLRRGAVLSPAVSGAAAGLLGGLAGVVVLEIHCPDLNVAHILFAHWGVALAFAAVGWLAGARIEKRDASI
jgi:hypothetical protein